MRIFKHPDCPIVRTRGKECRDQLLAGSTERRPDAKCLFVPRDRCIWFSDLSVRLTQLKVKVRIRRTIPRQQCLKLGDTSLVGRPGAGRGGGGGGRGRGGRRGRGGGI